MSLAVLELHVHGVVFADVGSIYWGIAAGRRKELWKVGAVSAGLKAMMQLPKSQKLSTANRCSLKLLKSLSAM